MHASNADSLDGYVVTADGSFFYEKYNEKTEQIDRTKIGDCKRQLKNSGLRCTTWSVTYRGRPSRAR